MLKSLRIQNYRSLEDLNVGRLGRVNLIVGKNNSGKSTLLEALRVYAADASLEILRQVSEEHEEPWRFDGQVLPYMPFECLFHQRAFGDISKTIVIAQDLEDKNALSIKKTSLVEIEEPIQVLTESGEKITRSRRLKIPLEMAKSGMLLSPESPDDGTLALLYERNGMSRWHDLADDRGTILRGRGSSEFMPFSFVPTRLLSSDILSSLNDKIVFTEFEDEVKRALKLVSKDVEGVAFIEGGRRTPRKQAVVKMVDTNKPVPLNSMGEGMSRVLQLILSVPPAQNGMLLIDEFENGLHYSVQEKVWNLIFDLSVQFNIQVFATTHSWDCIESFAKVAEERPEEGALLRLERSVLPEQEGKIVAIEYNEDELSSMTKANFEVR
jgi:AAA15 family ATPase/GTPase